MGSQDAQGGFPAPTGLVSLIPNTVYVFELDVPAQETSQRLLILENTVKTGHTSSWGEWEEDKHLRLTFLERLCKVILL